MKDMTPLQRKKGAALVLARICEAYGRMLLLEGLFQVGTWSSRAFWQCLRRSPSCMALQGQSYMAICDAAGLLIC